MKVHPEGKLHFTALSTFSENLCSALLEVENSASMRFFPSAEIKTGDVYVVLCEPGFLPQTSYGIMTCDEHGVWLNAPKCTQETTTLQDMSTIGYTMLDDTPTAIVQTTGASKNEDTTELNQIKSTTESDDIGVTTDLTTKAKTTSSTFRPTTTMCDGSGNCYERETTAQTMSSSISTDSISTDHTTQNIETSSVTPVIDFGMYLHELCWFSPEKLGN